MQTEKRYTAQGLEIIPNCPTPTCCYCGDENHFGICAEMATERERASKFGAGRPMPITHSGPATRRRIM